MNFQHTPSSAAALAALACDALILIVQGEHLDKSLDRLLIAAAQQAVTHGDLSLKAGKTVCLHRVAGVKALRVVFSVSASSSPKDFKAAVIKGLALIKDSHAKKVCIGWAGDTDVSALHAEAMVSAVSDATYLFRTTKPSAPPVSALHTASLLCDKSEVDTVTLGLTRGQAIANGVALARECANLPANHCTPTWLGDQAKKMGKEWGLKVEVLDQKQIEKLGMGSFLAVAQGSDEPPRFIVARYEGAAKTKAPLVLVGKGITFDTGGISLKPGAEMDEMKFDMGGAASVLGALRAVAELKPKLNLVVLVPTCENMPSGRAIKPGDVVKSMSGQTIEILNTDAEGRLILCDALTYAERFKPEVVVDVATLTGACVIALGAVHSGMFTAHEELAQQLLAAGRLSLDTCWRMPLDADYDELLKSNFADIPNISGGRAAGSITAAKFLERFTSKYLWAHLDIAGTAWKSGATKGSTGRPVGLLTHFVLSRAA
jgi:leucyl aminopeptidase